MSVVSADEMSCWSGGSVDLPFCPNCNVKDIEGIVKTVGGIVACSRCLLILFQSTNDFDSWLDEVEELEERTLEAGETFKDQLLHTGSALPEIPSEFTGRWKNPIQIGIFDIKPSGSYQYSTGIQNGTKITVVTEVGVIKVYSAENEGKAAFDFPFDYTHYFVFQILKTVTERDDCEQFDDTQKSCLYFANLTFPSSFPFLLDASGMQHPYSSSPWQKTSTSPSALEKLLDATEEQNK